MSLARENPKQPRQETPDEITYQKGANMGLSINDVTVSKFLKKEDIGEGKYWTISRVQRENISAEGADPEYKVCVHFQESEKPLVLNSTNATIIGKITGFDEDIDKNWVGHKIVLYVDENVTYKGKLVGGIRVRKAKQQAQQPPPPPADESDGLPF